MTMEEALTELRATFPGEKSWAYAVEQHQVQIGVWDNGKLIFRKGYDPKYLLELRVFNGREIRVVPDGADGFLLRDSAALDNINVFDDKYIIYGEKAKYEDGYTVLSEERGGRINFPKRIEFPPGKVELKLKVRQFCGYNEVPVLPKGEVEVDEGLEISGRGALEIYDFAFMGFFDANGKEVVL